MALEVNRSDDEKFVPGQHYTFDPPLETNCIAVPGGEWVRRRFAEGWCLKYEPKRNAFAFQGKPVGEKGEYYFHVEWGKGSVATDVPAPYLRVVK